MILWCIASATKTSPIVTSATSNSSTAQNTPKTNYFSDEKLPQITSPPLYSQIKSDYNRNTSRSHDENVTDHEIHAAHPMHHPTPYLHGPTKTNPSSRHPSHKNREHTHPIKLNLSTAIHSRATHAARCQNTPPRDPRHGAH